MDRNYYLLTNLLSDEEIRIITSIIEHIEKGEGRVGIQQIAAENYVSSTFIIKMCKRLGFDGYSELYYHLSQRISENSQPQLNRTLQGLVDNYTDEMGSAFCQMLDRFHERKIFAEGNGFADIVADYIVQRMSVCGFMVFNQVQFYDFMIFHENQQGLTTNLEPSLLIAVSQSGEATQVLENARAAKQRGYSVVCFTRRADSTLAELSDLCFVVDGTKQTLIGAVPNPFFGRVILAFEELMGLYLGRNANSEKM